MANKEVVAMLLAGGQGSRLGILTKKVAKPAVMYGGKYRIIDFPLSNCINSGIDTVGVLTQYEHLLLTKHIGIGIPWDLDRKSGGVTVLSPYQGEKEGTWYSGTANAIFQNIRYIENQNPKYVLILSGDHIYKMDYSKMLSYHKQNNCDATIAVLEVPMEEASQFGIMNTDKENRIIEFEEKPENPKSNLASMGIYIFNWETLREALIKSNEANENSDFGKHIIPEMIDKKMRVYSYTFHDYWKDVGTVDAYWQANMELTNTVPEFNLYDEFWKIYTNLDHQPPEYVGENARLEHSLISEGSEIYGEIYNSVIGPNVRIGKGSVIRDSIIMAGTIIKEDTRIDHSIVAEQSVVGVGCQIGYGANTPHETKAHIYSTGISVIGDETVIPDGIIIGKNCEVSGITQVSSYENGQLNSGQSLIMEEGIV
ncbi:MAG TPA: glucose-1-phosphate adenylyltransferase [Epulopiscium sp.]|nr:glucose-1-phosphate adenylyltransferase [Candidatus Epulonipiscium sp.]